MKEGRPQLLSPSAVGSPVAGKVFDYAAVHVLILTANHPLPASLLRTSMTVSTASSRDRVRWSSVRSAMHNWRVSLDCGMNAGHGRCTKQSCLACLCCRHFAAMASRAGWCKPYFHRLVRRPACRSFNSRSRHRTRPLCSFTAPAVLCRLAPNRSQIRWTSALCLCSICGARSAKWLPLRFDWLIF